MDEKQAAEEAAFRKVESAMAFLEDAGRKLGEAAAELSTEGAPAHLVRAPEVAAVASKDAHRQLVRLSITHLLPTSEVHGPPVRPRLDPPIASIAFASMTCEENEK